MVLTDEQMSTLIRLMGESIANAINETKKDAKASNSDDGGEGGGLDRAFLEKQFTRVEKFAGGDKEWKSFSFDFKTAAKGVNYKVGEVFDKVEKSKLKIDADDLALEDGSKFGNVPRRSKELYGIMVLLTTGEAKQVVRDVASGCALEAWHALHKLYGRVSMAKTMRAYREVLNPPKAKKMEDVVAAVMAWEGKVRELEKMEEKEAISEMIKTAALADMVPEEIQQVIYQTVDEDGMNYYKMKEKVLAWSSNKAAAVAKLADIGNVAEEECSYCEDIFDVNSLSMVCYQCGGRGHPARLCPSKGVGKGGKGDGGKGGGKDGGGKGGKEGGGKVKYDLI